MKYRLYTLTSSDLINTLTTIKEKAMEECRAHLTAIYAEATSCPTMSNLIVEETESGNGEPFERLCSRYYLANFKKAVEDNSGKNPYNFTAELLLWEKEGETIIGANTFWGSARFLDFLDQLPFLSKFSSNLAARAPLLRMSILSPETYYKVDPAWGG